MIMMATMFSLIVPFVAPLAAPTADADIELYDYTVVKGDTCSAIARRVFGDRKAYDRIHEHNPTMGPTPHTLVPGTILKLPRAKQRPDARVTASERKVEARSPSDSVWQAAHQGFELFRGWRLSTLDRAFAEVTFRDTSRIYMRENTLVIIYGGSDGDARRSSTKATLDKGALRSRLGELSGGRALAVETPSANTQLTGGSALITVDPEGTSRVANHGGGRARVRSGKPGKPGKPVEVPERMGSKVRQGSVPTPPKPLPDTPRWATDNAGTYLVPDGGTGTIEGSWTSVPKAETYRVEVGRMAQGGFTMTSVQVPKTATGFEVHGLPAGGYFATVAAVDDDAFESPPSRLYETKVITAPMLAPTGDPVVIPPPRDGTAMAPVRVLPGSRLEVPNGLTCGAGDAVLSSEVVASGAGVQQVRCQDAAGEGAGGFAIDVVAITVAGVDGADAFTVVREAESTIDFTLRADAQLPPQLEVRAPGGFTVGPTRPGDDGGWRVEVTADATAASPATFEVVLAGTDVQLSAFSVVVQDATALPTEDQPTTPRDRHMIEAGVYGGFIAMATGHELLTTDSPLATDRRIVPVSPDVGVRVGYYPLRAFGIEIEGGLMPTRLREGSDVLLFEGRGSLIGQLPGRVTPFMLLGGGVTGLTSDPSVLGQRRRRQLPLGRRGEVLCHREPRRSARSTRRRPRPQRRRWRVALSAAPCGHQRRVSPDLRRRAIGVV